MLHTAKVTSSNPEFEEWGRVFGVALADEKTLGWNCVKSFMFRTWLDAGHVHGIDTTDTTGEEELRYSAHCRMIHINQNCTIYLIIVM